MSIKGSKQRMTHTIYQWFATYMQRYCRGITKNNEKVNICIKCGNKRKG